MAKLITRRRFLASAFGTLLAGGIAGYSFWECGDLEVVPVDVPLAGLPRGFRGCRIAFLSDFHHGPFISREHIAGAVGLANAAHPDLVLLGGDFIHRETSYLAPVAEELGKLSAPLGVFAVLGNRDIFGNRMMASKELARNGIRELTNKGLWIEREGSRIWLCGMDDYTIGRPDPKAAMVGAPPDAFALAITHNPDVCEKLDEPRIRLVCCGHTHGGQINFPLWGRPFVPSAYGEKYALGLVKAPSTKVYVTTGVGSVFPPLRFRCPPEVALLRLVSAGD